MKVLKQKKLILPIGVGMVLIIVGTVGALNGWFGGGAKIPEDTMTRGLVGYWSFDEASGPLVFDKSNEGNNGMINDGGSGNPVAYWTFDEGSGSTAYDYIGGNNGTLTNSPTWTSNGKVGGALQFDGVDDYVDCGSDSSLVFGTDDLTVEAWFNAASDATNRIIVSNDNGVDKFYNLYLTSAHLLTFIIRDGAGWKTIDSTSAVDDGNWHHAVGFREGDNIKLYLDGVLVDSDTGVDNYNITDTPINIGRASKTGGVSYFNGLIDDVKIYDYARTADDIREDYLETYKTKFVDGKVGGAMEFDGVDDYVDAGNDSSLKIEGALTIEAWIYPTTDTYGNIVANYYGGNRAQYRFARNQTKYLTFDTNDGTAKNITTGSNLVEKNIWTHVAVTRASIDGSVFIYINGVEKGSGTSSNVPPDNEVDNTEIGASGLETEFFNGTIDEVRIYNRALSKEEVRYHYNRGGPVAHWKFDEGNGTTTYDGTDNGNDGTLGDGTTAYVPTWVTGKYGTALQFDGENDYVEIDDTSLDLSSANKVTEEAWVKLDSRRTTDASIFRQHTGPDMTVGTNDKLKFSPDGGAWGTASSGSVPEDKWAHIAIVFDGATDEVKYYINGSLDSVVTMARNLGSQGSYTEIGGGKVTLPTNGLIDDVRIYNYARTADEIRLDYNAGFGVRFGGSPADDMTRGLVGYWNFDEGSGSTAYDSSGQGHHGTLSTAWLCGDNVTFTYRGSQVTYGTVSSQDECWLDRDLGASQVATAYNDSAAYGDLFQWGRLDDNHQDRSSGLTTSLSSSDDPGHSNFIYGMGSPYDWRSPQNDNLWQGVSGTNNPCPSGWRIPTETELDTERASWGQQNYNGAYASPIKFTAGGYRIYSNGALSSVGTGGRYWSSTVDGMEARRLYVYSYNAGMSSSRRAYGFSVRCVKD